MGGFPSWRVCWLWSRRVYRPIAGKRARQACGQASVAGVVSAWAFSSIELSECFPVDLCRPSGVWIAKRDDAVSDLVIDSSETAPDARRFIV